MITNGDTPAHTPMEEDEEEDEDLSTGDGNAGPMWDQDGVHDIYRAWNKVLAEYPNDRALAAEAWVNDIDRMARYVRSDEMQDRKSVVEGKRGGRGGAGRAAT